MPGVRDNETLEEIRREWMTARKQMLASATSALILLTIGAVFFHVIEKLSWINAFYFCTVSLATVGYGDIVPKTDGEKLFIMAYILVGIGIIATFANLLIKSGSLRREYKRNKRRQSRSG